MKTAPTIIHFDDLLVCASPQGRAIAATLRALIVAQHPDCTELVWPKLKTASFGMGPKKMTQHYAYIALQSAHVNLGFYHGTSLADPTRLLEGTGKALRHVKVRNLATAQCDALAGLLRAAIRERQT